MNKPLRGLVHATMATALAVGGIAVATAAPAAAATGSCRLTISPDPYNKTLEYVEVTCTPRTQFDRMKSFDIMGEDTFSDDHLYGPAVTGNVQYFKITVFDRTLNEDLGNDEIYVNVRFEAGTGGTYVIRSPKVTSSWS